MRFWTLAILVVLFSPSAPAENWSEDFEGASDWSELTARGWNVVITYGGYLDLARQNPWSAGSSGLGAGSDANYRVGDYLMRTWTPDVPTDLQPVTIEHWIGFADNSGALEKWTFIQDSVGGAWIAVGAYYSQPGAVWLRVNPTGWANGTGGISVGNWADGEWFRVTIELGSTDANITVYDPVADTSQVFNLGAPLSSGSSDMLNEIYIGNYYPYTPPTRHRRRGYWDDISVQQGALPTGVPERDWASY